MLNREAIKLIDDNDSRYCSVCKRTHALCQRSMCAVHKLAANRLAVNFRKLSALAWLDWLQRGCEAERAHPLQKLWLVVTGGVPSVVERLEAGDVAWGTI